MLVEVQEVFGTDRMIANAARTTIGKDRVDKELPKQYMKRMYMCEHSPIRIKSFNVKVFDVPYWIVMHFVRHNVGVTHFVSTQREDRTGESRGEQDALVDWEFVVNAAALIGISRKRLCKQAHEQTIRVWTEVLNKIAHFDQPLVNACVPDCVYRGWCYEYKSCGMHKTDAYLNRLSRYREGINE